MEYEMKSISDFLTTTEEDKDLIRGIEDGDIRVVLGHRSLMALVHDGNPRLLSFLCRSDNLIKILTVATTSKDQYLIDNPIKEGESEQEKKDRDEILSIFDDEQASAGIRSLIEAAPSKFCVDTATNKDVLSWARGSVKRTSCVSKLALKRGVADNATEEFSKEIYRLGNYGVSGVPHADTLNSICEHIAEHHNCHYGYGSQRPKNDEDQMDVHDPDSVKILVRSMLTRKFSGRTTAEWLCDIARKNDNPNDVAEAFNSLSILLLSTHKQLELEALYAGWLEPWDKCESNKKKIEHNLDENSKNNKENLSEIIHFPLTRESLRYAVISARLVSTRWSVLDEDISEFIHRQNQQKQDKSSVSSTSASAVLDDGFQSAKLKTSSLILENKAGLENASDFSQSPKLEKTDDVSEPSVDGYDVHDYEPVSDAEKEEEPVVPYLDVLRSVPIISPIDAGRILQHIIDWVSSFFKNDNLEKITLKTLLDLVSAVSELGGIPFKTLEFNKNNKIYPAGATLGFGSSTTGSNPYGNTGNSGDFFFSSYGGNSLCSSQITPENLLIAIKGNVSKSSGKNEYTNDINLKSPTPEEEGSKNTIGHMNGDIGEELMDIKVLLNDNNNNGNENGNDNNYNSPATTGNRVPNSNNFASNTNNGINSIPSTTLSANTNSSLQYKVPPASPLRILVGLQRNGVVKKMTSLIFGSDEKQTPPSRVRCSILHSAYIRLIACYIEFAGVIQESNDVVNDVIMTICKFYNETEGSQMPYTDKVQIRRAKRYQYSLCKTLLRMITLTIAGECVADEVAGSISTLSDIGQPNPLLMSSSGRSGIVGSEVGGASWSGSGININLFKVQGNGLFENVNFTDVQKEVCEKSNKAANMNSGGNNLMNTPIFRKDQNMVPLSSTNVTSNSSIHSTSINMGLGDNNTSAYGDISCTMLGVLLERLQKKRKQASQGRGVGGSTGSSFTFSSLGNSLGRGSTGLNINVSDIGYAASSGIQFSNSTYCSMSTPIISSSATLEIVNKINHKVAEEEDKKELSKTCDDNGEEKKFNNLKKVPIFDTLLDELIIIDERHGCRYDSSVVTRGVSQRETAEISEYTCHNKNPMRPFDGKVRKSRKNHTHHNNDDKSEDDESTSSSISFNSSQDSYSGDDDFTPISDPKSSSDYSSSSDQYSDNSSEDSNGNTKERVKPITKPSRINKKGSSSGSSSQVYLDNLLNESSGDDELIFEDGNSDKKLSGDKPKKSVIVKETDDWDFNDDMFKPEPNITGNNIDGEGDFHADFQADFEGDFAAATFDNDGTGFGDTFDNNDKTGYEFKFEDEACFEDNNVEGKN